MQEATKQTLENFARKLRFAASDLESAVRQQTTDTPQDEGNERGDNKDRLPISLESLTQLYVECLEYAGAVADQGIAARLASSSLSEVEALNEAIADCEGEYVEGQILQIPTRHFDMFTGILNNALKYNDISFGAPKAEIAFSMAWALGLSEML